MIHKSHNKVPFSKREHSLSTRKSSRKRQKNVRKAPSKQVRPNTLFNRFQEIDVSVTFVHDFLKEYHKTIPGCNGQTLTLNISNIRMVSVPKSISFTKNCKKSSKGTQTKTHTLNPIVGSLCFDEINELSQNGKVKFNDLIDIIHDGIVLNEDIDPSIRTLAYEELCMLTPFRQKDSYLLTVSKQGSRYRQIMPLKLNSTNSKLN